MTEVQDHMHYVTIAYEGDGKALVRKLRAGRRSIRCEKITHYHDDRIIEAVVSFRATADNASRVADWLGRRWSLEAGNWVFPTPSEGYRIEAASFDVSDGLDCAVKVSRVKPQLTPEFRAELDAARTMAADA